jgi:Flp pilus assembly protein TadD
MAAGGSVTGGEGDGGRVDAPRPEPAPGRERALECLRKFLALSSRGAKQDALVAASDACHAAPDMPEAHYGYGQAWLALGEPARAERAFAEAVRLKPTWADAWVNYGLARYHQGALDEARVAMRRALACDPEHAAARCNLGAFMRISGAADVSQDLLRDSVERDPQNAGARLNLVADLLQQDQPGDALALLEEAAPPPEDMRAARHWHLQKFIALLRLDRVDEARATLEALAELGPLPPDVAPLWHWRQVLLAVRDGDLDKARAAAGLTEAALVDAGTDAVLDHQIMGHFRLARFWSGAGEHSQAFAQWARAHELLKLVQPFSREDHLAFIEANIAAFNAQRFTTGARASNTDPAPIFIVGMPRTGIKLCERILAAHADVHGAGERDALNDAFCALGEINDKRSAACAAAVTRIVNLDAQRLNVAAERYLNALHALAPGKAHIVDRLPSSYLFLGLVGLMLPGAKIIHCIKDPRAVGLAIFSYRFHRWHDYAHDLADLGCTIAQQQRLMAHWKDVLPNPILTIKLADWFNDFDGTLARVLAHVELPHDPQQCARFYEANRKARRASRWRVGDQGGWGTYRNELAPLIDELERAGALDGWGKALARQPTDGLDEATSKTRTSNSGESLP